MIKAASKSKTTAENKTLSSWKDFDQSEFENQLSKLQQAFNMPNIGQQMAETKQKEKSSVAAEVIAKALKMAK